MKKVLSLVLALVMLLSLAACGKDAPTPADSQSGQTSGSQTAADGTGGTQAFENKIALSLDKTHYEKAERIEVSLDFAEAGQEYSVVLIINSETEHGKMTPSQEDSEEYRFLSDFDEIPFYMYAPEKDGLFDARVYSDSGLGKELASVTFAVGSAQLTQTTVPPTDPPKDGSNIKKAYFNPPKAIYMDVWEGGSTAGEGGTYSFALLDGNYSYTISPDGIFFHDSAETKTQYCPCGDGWRIDNSANEGGRIPEEDLTYEMTGYLDTFCHDAENGGYYNNISKYYVGTETICYRNCYVYEIRDDGFGVYKKFWMDPENGATLKYVERADGEGSEITYEFEVTQYNLLGPVWNSTMRPDYGSVTEMLY